MWQVQLTSLLSEEMRFKSYFCISQLHMNISILAVLSLSHQVPSMIKPILMGNVKENHIMCMFYC